MPTPAQVANPQCFACLQPTDTALAITGEAEAHIAACRFWGVPDATITRLLRERAGTNWPGAAADEVPSGSWAMQYRICKPCAAKSHMEPTLYVDGGELRNYRPPGH